MEKCCSCNCVHHSFGPILVILFGLTFLLGTLGVLASELVAIVWPSIVILGGLGKLLDRKCKCC
ncbi:hypothetical protein HYV44_01590 [Candidatus Microgenomates bacterium]|nr:hypothetical protein [Candidatus Microgenomates bacterium]